ncbi:bifunctional 3,4-dihydroxy-2-butanone-4-phosphate synthase/GTP cyclohydrolase II [Nocardioides yefusunii]|uniref:Riboflavin biosynthesis protein RibBA n=1 Tax=Nocardioides yefusunii TaxID=2500546 RepID=A0ABW1QUF1_9ACTN|nr:bifunctional 3,4-dihydroxy-2-butanone-4-phosphate synthase/GTP cyclohydrolase II [Nocardioides yefusunii]
MSIRLDTVEAAIAAVAAGGAVIVVDDEDRENEGDIIFAADAATPELMAFTVRHSSGVICVPLEAERLSALDIPLMTPHNQDPLRTAYTVSVDAAVGVSTGISAADRAHTARLLADPDAVRGDFTRPGHVFQLRYRAGGVLVRRGHTEAAVDLARLAGRAPVGVLVEVVNDDGTMKRGQQLRDFADDHGLPMISIDALVAHRRRTELHVERLASTPLPTAHGVFAAHGYRSLLDDTEHVALVVGDLSDPAEETDGRAGGEAPLVRVHSECLTGDVLGSARCDCGPQLEESLRQVQAAGRGVVVYLRGHEGRGIGLVEKLRAYALQDDGADTLDANLALGHPGDARTYETAAHVLRDLGVTSVRLLTNNPDKARQLAALGIEVEAVEPLVVAPTPENLHYLQTKRDRFGHAFPSLEEETA